MTNLEKKLETLYIEKNRIEDEIEFVKNQIRNENDTIKEKKKFSKDEKIELFKSLFVARFDIYAKKWISKDGLKQGFFPVTATFQAEDYLPFTNLMNKCYLVVTDSGGVQEEAPSLGKPVLVVRRETERPEGIEAGTAKLAGTDRENIYNELHLLLNNEEEYKKMANAVNPYGDGKAAEFICNLLIETYQFKIKSNS